MGCYFFIDGLLALGIALSAKRGGTGRARYVIEGVLSLMVGALAVARPTAMAGAVLALMAGARSIIAGVVEIATAISLRQSGGEHHWPIGLGGIVSLGFGVFLFARPTAAWSCCCWRASTSWCSVSLMGQRSGCTGRNDACGWARPAHDVVDATAGPLTAPDNTPTVLVLLVRGAESARSGTLRPERPPRSPWPSSAKRGERRQRQPHLPDDAARPAADRALDRAVVQRADDPVGREPVLARLVPYYLRNIPLAPRAASVRAVRRIHPRGGAGGGLAPTRRYDRASCCRGRSSSPSLAFMLLAAAIVRTYRFMRVERILGLVRGATFAAIARRDGAVRAAQLVPVGAVGSRPTPAR